MQFPFPSRITSYSISFHPAIQRVKAILDSGELGKIKSIDAKMALLAGLIKEDDIRFRLDLAGGATMDLGCKFIFD